MIFRRPKLDSLLSRAKSYREEDVAEEEKELTESKKAEAAEAQFIKIDDGDDEEVDAITEKYFKQMGSGEEEAEEEVRVDLKDILAAPEQTEEAPDAAPEKVKEKMESGVESKETDGKVDSEAKDKKGVGLLDDLFEEEVENENSYLDGLIASLPDIQAQELFKYVEEVKGLMEEWQQHQK